MIGKIAEGKPMSMSDISREVSNSYPWYKRLNWQDSDQTVLWDMSDLWLKDLDRVSSEISQRFITEFYDVLKTNARAEDARTFLRAIAFTSKVKAEDFLMAAPYERLTPMQQYICELPFSVRAIKTAIDLEHQAFVYWADGAGFTTPSEPYNHFLLSNPGVLANACDAWMMMLKEKFWLDYHQQPTTASSMVGRAVESVVYYASEQESKDFAEKLKTISSPKVSEAIARCNSYTENMEVVQRVFAQEPPQKIHETKQKKRLKMS